MPGLSIPISDWSSADKDVVFNYDTKLYRALEITTNVETGISKELVFQVSLGGVKSNVAIYIYPSPSYLWSNCIAEAAQFPSKHPVGTI